MQSVHGSVAASNARIVIPLTHSLLQASHGVVPLTAAPPASTERFLV